MQHLNTLWQLVNAASTVTELARHTQTYRFGVMSGPITLYLRAEQAEVQIARWGQPQVVITAQLQAAFGWRVASDQDEAGVYFVARRRPVVGGLSRALFRVSVPYNTFLVLKLDGGRLTLEAVHGTLELGPTGMERE